MGRAGFFTEIGEILDHYFSQGGHRQAQDPFPNPFHGKVLLKCTMDASKLIFCLR